MICLTLPVNCLDCRKPVGTVCINDIHSEYVEILSLKVQNRLETEPVFTFRFLQSFTKNKMKFRSMSQLLLAVNRCPMIFEKPS